MAGRATDSVASIVIKSRSRGHLSAANPKATGITMIPLIGGFMANVLIRDLDEDVLTQLKASAKAHGRSLQAEIHDVLERAGTRNLAATRRLSAQWLKRLRRPSHSDSAALIRQDRDAR